MDINQYKHIWTTNKEKYVLVKLGTGYGIYNQENKTGIIIEDDETYELVVANMIKNENKVIRKIWFIIE